VIHYVTRWPMQIARSALETEGATVAELADGLGYKPEGAFARAFKRVSGIPPGAVERRSEHGQALRADSRPRWPGASAGPRPGNATGGLHGDAVWSLAGPVRRLAHTAGRNPETEGG
jgi:hypothetical protein